MQISVCLRSLGAGFAAGMVVLGVIWYGSTLASRAAITQQLLALARCDSGGFVAITFADASQFTCAPRETQPPTSAAEAARRGRKVL